MDRRLYTFGLLASPFLLLVPFWLTLVTLHARWLEVNGSYSHGYLLLAVVAYLLFCQIRDWPETAIFNPSLTAVIFGFGGLFVWLVGFATQTQVLEQIALPFILWAWVATVFGWRTAFKVSVSFLLLYFAIPVWDFLLMPLRIGTMGFVQALIELMALPVLFDGFLIMLPVGTLVVAGGCSGLNYFMVALVIGSVNGLVLFDSWKSRALTLLVIAILAVVGNWVRVSLLVLIAYYSEMQSSLVRDHGLFGWLVFAVFLLPYFYLLTRLRQSSTSGIKPWAALMRLPSLTMLYRSIAYIALIAILPVWLLSKEADELASFSPLKGVAGHGFESREQHAYWLPRYRHYDRTDSLISSVGGEEYELTAVSYLTQQQGKELIYYANVLAPETHLRHLSPLVLKNGTLNRSLVGTSKGWRKVWWHYQVGGRITHSKAIAKLLQLPAIISDDRQASILLLSTRCKNYRCQGELQETPLQQRMLDDWLLGLSAQ